MPWPSTSTGFNGVQVPVPNTPTGKCKQSVLMTVLVASITAECLALSVAEEARVPHLGLANGLTYVYAELKARAPETETSKPRHVQTQTPALFTGN